MVSTRGVRYKFTEGERVLCYEPDPTKAKVLYDSKVLEVIESKDKRGRRTIEYLIHFQGWNSSWDRCVSEDYVLKDTEENRQLQRDLAEKSQLQLGAYLYRRERKKGSTSSAGAGPAKRSRQGFSDDGSSSSTQPDEAEGEADGSSQSRGETGDTDSSGSGSGPRSPLHANPGRANIQLPPALRDRLTFDYHLVVKRGRLSKLPASPSVAQILESFVKWFARAGAWHPPRGRSEPPQKPDFLDVSCRLNLVREVADGLRMYFDFILRGHLLYKQEMNQYHEMCGQYIDEQVTHIKEECESIERSGSDGSGEDMKSPRIPEYSHLPPDPYTDTTDNTQELHITTPSNDVHQIIIIKKEIKLEPNEEVGEYEEELLIQMDIKEEQHEVEYEETQEYYQEYENQSQDDNQNLEHQEYDNQGDEHEFDNQGDEQGYDEDNQGYEEDDQENDNQDYDLENQEEQEDFENQEEEEEDFEIELDEENYRQQMEERQEQRNREQESQEMATTLDDKLLKIENESDKQIDLGLNTENQPKLADEPEKTLLPESEAKEKQQTQESGKYMTLRRKQLIGKQMEKESHEDKTVITCIEHSNNSNIGSNKNELAKQVDDNNDKKGDTKSVDDKTHSRRKSHKLSAPNEIDKEIQTENNVNTPKIITTAIETRSAGKRRNEKLIEALQEDDKPLSDIQSSVRQIKNKQIDPKNDSQELSEPKSAGGKQQTKGKHAKHDNDEQNPKFVEKRGKHMDGNQDKSKPIGEEQTVVNVVSKSGKGKHIETKHSGGKEIKEKSSSKQMTLRQGSGKQIGNISSNDKIEGKNIDVKQESDIKYREVLGSGKHEGKRLSGKQCSNSSDLKHGYVKQIDDGRKGRGKQIFEMDDVSFDSGKDTTRTGKEMILRSKGNKDLKSKGEKQIEVEEMGEKQIELSQTSNKQISVKDSDKQTDVKETDCKDISAQSGKQISAKESCDKNIKTEIKECVEKQINTKTTVQNQLEGGKQQETKETTKKHIEHKHLSKKETNVQPSKDNQTDISEKQIDSLGTVDQHVEVKTEKGGKHIEFKEVCDKQIKQEIDSQDEEIEDDRDQERRSSRKRGEKQIDSQMPEKRGKKRQKSSKSLSESEDKPATKDEVFDENKAIKLEIKEEKDDSSDKHDRLSPLEDPMDSSVDARNKTLSRRGHLARRLRSHKSGVSHSENEEPLPCTSGLESRALEAVASSVCSSGSSMSEGWSRAAPAAPAPAPPTRTPLSLLFEKVAKWQIIPREGTEHLPCRVYGAIHLARLFVRLPDFLNATNMPDLKLKLILKNIDMFVQYLDEHSEWFGEQYYYADNFSRG